MTEEAIDEGGKALLALNDFMFDHEEHFERLRPVREALFEMYARKRSEQGTWTEIPEKFDPEELLRGFKEISHAPSDAEEAAKALRLIETYLRAGKPLPYFLAEHLAEAIRCSMHKKDKALRVPGFLRALGFTAGNRRKKTYYMDVGRYMEEQIESTACTETAAANRAAKAFKISRKTASGQFKEYLGNRIGLDAPLSEAEKILVPK